MIGWMCSLNEIFRGAGAATRPGSAHPSVPTTNRKVAGWRSISIAAGESFAPQNPSEQPAEIPGEDKILLPVRDVRGENLREFGSHAPAGEVCAEYNPLCAEFADGHFDE